MKKGMDGVALEFYAFRTQFSFTYDSFGLFQAGRHSCIPIIVTVIRISFSVMEPRVPMSYGSSTRLPQSGQMLFLVLVFIMRRPMFPRLKSSFCSILFGSFSYTSDSQKVQLSAPFSFPGGLVVQPSSMFFSVWKLLVHTYI